MVSVLVALLLFVLGYVLAKFLLSKVPPLAEIADVLAVVLGVLVALLYLGII